jgi:hypothetical protein
MRAWPVLVTALAAAFPAAAQQPGVLPPHPTETGKPVIFDPSFAAKADNNAHSACSPALSCRLQLLGVIQNNGTIELRATAFRW